MPFTSTQVSGLVGGQQVMFANQQSFSQMVGGGYSAQAPAQLQNPYPVSQPPTYASQPPNQNMGAQVAGGMGMAIPGMAAGGTMAASLLGYKNPLGLLDPFTGVSRAFGAGTGGTMAQRAGVMAGGQGMGLMQGMRNIGGAFAQGGLKAGAGALAGGLAGAAAAAVPYYVAGKAIETIGSNIHQGAQNIADVRRMTTQYMDPQFGGGGPTGGGPSRSAVKGITSFLGDLASQDTMHSMQDMRRVMDRAGQAGMLEGLGDVNQFKQKFKKVLDATKTVAKIMGTTLEEAMPLVQSLQKMGTWSAADVMGIATEAKAMGPGGGGAMVGAMQTGASMSHAMGGTMAAGAATGRALFGQVTAGRQAGTFSERDIQNYTGGVGGAEGRQMVAGSLQQVMAGMGNTAMGRLMSAGLGEIKGGEFTGRMDEEKLDRFRSGEISIGQLQAQGKKRVNTQNLATSFFNKQGEMGQNLAAQGGIETMAQGIQAAMEKAGRGNAPDAIQNRFISLLTGANQRQADMIQKMIQDLPRIQAERTRRMEGALEDSFKQLEARKGGISGLKDAISGAFERGVERPLQELGENLSVGMGDMMDRWSEKLGGTVRNMPRVGQQEMMNLRMQGSLDKPPSLQQMGVANMGQRFMDPGGLQGISMDMDRAGAGRRILGGMAGGAAIGGAAGALGLGVTAIPGAIGGAVVGGLAGAMGFDPIGAMQVDARGGMNVQGEGGRRLNLSGNDVTNLSARARSFVGSGLAVSRGEAAADEIALGGGLKSSRAAAVMTARRSMMRAGGATIGGLLGGEDEKKRTAQSTVNAALRSVLSDPAQSKELREMKESRPDEYARELMKRVRQKGGGSVSKALKDLTKDHPMGAASDGAVLDVAAIGMREVGAQGGDFAVDFSKDAELQAGIAFGTPEELAIRQNEIFDEMADSSGAFGGFWNAVGAGAATGAIAGGIMGAGVFSIPGALLGAAGGALVGGLGNLMSADMSQSDFKEALTSSDFTAADVASYARGKKETAFGQTHGNAAASKLRKHIDAMTPEEKKKFASQLDESGMVRAGQAAGQERERLQNFARRSGPVGDIKGVGADIESKLEDARKEMIAGGGVGKLTAAGTELSKDELTQLRKGRGGELGKSAALLQDIERMGEMTEKQFEKFRGRKGLGATGVDLVGSIQASLKGKQREDFEEMLKGGIKGAEVGKLKEMLKQAAPAAVGTGAGAKTDPFMAQLQKYTAANERFVFAVGSVLGDKLEKAGKAMVEATPTSLKAR